MKETGDMLRKHCRVFYGVDSSDWETRASDWEMRASDWEMRATEKHERASERARDRLGKASQRDNHLT